MKPTKKSTKKPSSQSKKSSSKSGIASNPGKKSAAGKTTSSTQKSATNRMAEKPAAKPEKATNSAKSKQAAAKPAATKHPGKPASASKSKSAKTTRPQAGPSKPKEAPRITAAKKKGSIKKTNRLSGTKKSTGAARKKVLKIPSILLEGDRSATTEKGGPGQRYALGQEILSLAVSGEGELPERYGTRKLFLALRDPEWIYAAWDFTRDQLAEANRSSSSGHLILRLYRDKIQRAPIAETAVHPESTHWFLHIGPGGRRKIIAELGCYTTTGNWKQLATSNSLLTPTQHVSEDTEAQFVTIKGQSETSFDLPVQKTSNRSPKKGTPKESSTQTTGSPTAHQPTPFSPVIVPAQPPSEWTSQQEHDLTEVVSMVEVKRHWGSSLDLLESIQPERREALSSIELADLKKRLEEAGKGGISSPMDQPPAERGFWFNVNAELIVYGATDPNAHVSIGGRTIRLKEDGSFSYRFSLPDGSYGLPITAVSPDQVESRKAALHFHRHSEYHGPVAPHPQDPKLKSPKVQNLD